MPRHAQILLPIFATIFFLSAAGWPQVASQASIPLWKAQWITAPEIPQRDQAVLHFRRVIELAVLPAHFYVDVSADNQFILHVNQQRVGTGPSRSDLGHWRFETYDLAPFMHAGKNVLAATVWNLGPNAAIAQMSDRMGFLVHGRGAEESVADTGEQWDVERETAIRTQRPDLEGYYAAESGMRMDAGAFDWQWDTDSEAGAGWKKAVPVGAGALRGATDPPTNWQLVSDPLPAMDMKLVAPGKVVRATGVDAPIDFPSAALTIAAHTKASILIDNGTLTTGYPALTAGGSGGTIRLTYAEALVDEDGHKGNRNEVDGRHITGVVDEFLLGGPQSREFMPLTWRTWRYLQIDVEAGENPVSIEGLKTWFSAFPFAEKGYFSSDDPSLKPIWDIGWRTARLDAHDTYMDTPYWERLQYVGDTRIQALISYAVAGDDRLARQAIDAFNNSRIPDGLTQSRYPSSLVQMIPTFSLLWVGMVHDFWLYRNDPEFVRAQLAGTRAVLDWYRHQQRADGLLGRLPWWPFVDWGKDFGFGMPPQEQNGGSAIITLQFIEALRDAAELEDALGDKRIAGDYRKAAVRAATAVRKLCWDKQYGLIADDPGHKHFSQHANILAVWLDVIPRKQQRDLLEKILSTTDRGFSSIATLPPMTAATYYFRFYLARALLHAGMGDQYLRLLGPWREMVSLGLTTWAESPEPTRSDSHAWSAHPNFDLLTIVAGIRPGAAGFKSVTIEPHLGELQHLDVAVPVQGGSVEVNYQRLGGKGLEAKVTLPAGMSGTLNWKGHRSRLHPGQQTVTIH
jgi:alpha-L-rhamnosidase